MSGNKDSYDELLQFSRITQDNWLLADRKNRTPFGAWKKDWVKPFLEPCLEATVPRDVIKVFEIARGSMIYSWFFYPLATLGFEQCTRVAEFAIRERCQLLGRKPGMFAANIATLKANGLISATDEPRWQAMRRIRNDRSHVNGFMLMDPMQAAGVLHVSAELINKLFSSTNKAVT